MTGYLVAASGLLVGGALVVHAVRLRQGRTPATRDWQYAREKHINHALLSFPGAGLVLLGVALSPWAGTPGWPLVAAIALIAPGMLLVLLAMTLPRVPLRLLPDWAREPVARRRSVRSAR